MRGCAGICCLDFALLTAYRVNHFSSFSRVFRKDIFSFKFIKRNIFADFICLFELPGDNYWIIELCLFCESFQLFLFCNYLIGKFMNGWDGLKMHELQGTFMTSFQQYSSCKEVSYFEVLKLDWRELFF